MSHAYQSYHDQPSPSSATTSYQQQSQHPQHPQQHQHGATSHPTPQPNESDWDPEALGQALLTDESQSDWSAVTNLDAFFCKVYTYFVEKGFWCMIAARLTNLLTLAFTICFSSFLLLFINWQSLLFCSSSSCSDIIGWRSEVFTSPNTIESLIFLYFIVFSVYWCWNLLSFFYALRDALEMRVFYKEDLKIEDDDLVSLEWHYILESLVLVSARKKLCIVKDLSALDITNRIMRKENYMVAMINLDLFQTGFKDAQGRWNVIPCVESCLERRRDQIGYSTSQQQQGTEMRKVLRERRPAGTNQQQIMASPPSAAKLKNPLLHPDAASSSSSQPHQHPNLPASSSYDTFTSPTSIITRSSPSSLPKPAFTSWWYWAVMGTSLDWNIRFCVLNSLFDSHFYVHSGYLGSRGIAALKLRFMVLGVANLILSPFIMLFMIIFFFLRHSEELHSKKTLFGPRQWCTLAQWKMREFNELPHFFERRLTLSSAAAQSYMQQFPNTLVSIIAQSVAYITGALVGILLLITVTDSDIITHRIYDRSLLWYLAVFSGVLALSRSMIPDKTIYPAPALVMNEVVKHTHYSPPHWRGRTHTSDVHREVSYMYPSRLSMLGYEIMSVIATPFVLIFCLPHSAERIVQFVSTRTINVQGVGHLCSYAMFDLEKYGDVRYSHINGTATTAATAGLPSESKDNYRPPPSTSDRLPPLHGTGIIQRTPSVPPPSFPMRLKHGKLEKSFLGFSMSNPHWKPIDTEDGGSGAKFLGGLAESIYGESQAQETIGSIVESPKKPLGNIGASVRFSPSTGVTAASSSSSSPPKIPPNSSPVRQDSIDSNTTDEFDEDDQQGGMHDDSPTKQHQQQQQHAPSASYLLSQSDRHLIQSFADLVGIDPIMQSNLHPSTMMRQSSIGGGHTNVNVSMLGMSTMLGLKQRHQAVSMQRTNSNPSMPAYLLQSQHMRASHLGGGGGLGASQFLASPLNMSAFFPRGVSGGSIGGVNMSASTWMHDAQSVREGLMLAQAEQQPDMYALLEGRLEEEDEEEMQQEEGRDRIDRDEEEQIPIITQHHQQQQVHHTPPSVFVTPSTAIPHSSSSSSSHPLSAASSTTPPMKPSSFDARQYATSMTPPDTMLGQLPRSGGSSASSSSVSSAPQQHPQQHQPPLHVSHSNDSLEEDEPPPMDFFS